MVSDVVSLSNTLNSKDMNFVLVNKETNLDIMQADGVLGLGYDNEGNDKNSFVRQLYSQNQISAAKFSIYLSPEARGSKLILGDPNDSPQLRQTVSNMGSCTVAAGAKHWECQMASIKFNNTDIRTNSRVIFDTGASYLIIPINDFKLIKSRLLDSQGNASCGLTPLNQLVCKCSSPSAFGDLNIVINGHNLNIPSSQLVSHDPQSEWPCRFNILLSLNQNDPWVLGDAVLRGVLVTYDVTGRTISFAKTTLPSELTIEESKSSGSSFWWWFFIILGLILLVVIGWLIYRYCFAHPDSAHQEMGMERKEPMMKNK
jgi:hypothetical protein